MKKIFTPDALFVSLFSAAGYGFGYVIPDTLGAGAVPSLLCCLLVGGAMEALGEKLVFSRYFQEKKARRRTLLVCVAAAFLVLNFISVKVLKHSLFEDYKAEAVFGVGLPVAGFLVSIVLYYIRHFRLRAKYGDGEGGFAPDRGKNGDGLLNCEIGGDCDKEGAVTLAGGVYVPKKSKGLLSYLGIPYAKPPVGGLRFRAPERPDPSCRVFEAMHFGPSAPQPDLRGNPLSESPQSEDCLYLNVWTAATDVEAKKPVVVFFHGGDLRFGGSASPLCSGEQFIKDRPDTVFVSFNYRLGLFGFLRARFLPGEEAYPDMEDLGLLDQIAALTWVKENIAAFGGDPENVTVVGENAGAMCILLLSVCEKAKGLFKNAVLLSGSLREINAAAESACEASVKEFITELGVKSMDELARIPEKEFTESLKKAWQIGCVPKPGGTLLPKDIEKAFADGKAAGIRFLFGEAKDELGVYRSAVSEEEYGAWIADTLQYVFSLPGEETERLKSFFAEQKAALGEKRAAEMTVERWAYKDGLVSLLEKLRAAGNEAYAFRFEPETEIEKLGSGSLIMTATVLNNPKAAEEYGSLVNADTALVLQTLLLKFMRGERPALYHNEVKGVNAVDWAPYPRCLRITDTAFTCEEIL